MNTFSKILLLGFILILSSGIGINAQRNILTSDFFVGVNFAEMDIENANMYKTPKLGMLVGFNLNFKLKHNFQVQTGLYVTKKGLRQHIEQYSTNALNTTYIEDTVKHWSANYIQVPLCLGYEYYLTKSFAVNFNVGFYAAYGYKGEYNQEQSRSVIQSDGTTTNGAVEELEERNIYSRNGLKRFDYGAIARVGLIYDIFTINLSYEYGLANMNNRDSGLLNNPSLNNRNIALALGFRF